MATILHIEDDPHSLLLVRKLLQAAGHKVVECSSGIDGARLAQEQRPDLVLLDINIPDLDGYEVALLLRGRMPGVPIVAITAEGDRATSLAVGCDGFLAKPIDARTFARTVDAFLGGHREAPPEATEDDGDDGPRSARALRAQGSRIAAHLEAKVHELTDANAKLVEADRLRREFYRNVSHELATPLTPLVGYMGLLQRGELGTLTAAQKRAVTAMDESLARLRNTIDSLLDVTQLETGRMRFVYARYDFAAVARRAIESRRPALLRKNLRLVTDVPGAPIDAVGDADRLGRAMGHLLDNAQKFTPAGGTVALEVRSSATHCELLLADSGPGVPAEWLSRIFEPFVQVDGSPTRQHGGAGVGLAVVRGVAEAHDGGAIAEPAARFAIAGERLGGLLVRMQVARAPRPRE
ncbi:MAG: hybrid sensor histidine kinase/response regulator [Polyangiales bacterium]